jgi:uncharacterized protein
MSNHEAGAGWAVVTGASSGLGALFAEQLADRGMPLILAGRDEVRLSELRERVKRRTSDSQVELVVGDLGRLTHAVLPGMLERGRGGILNVASTIAFQPAPYQATYGASKAFVLSFSQALWAETRGTGLTVTALCPGPTRTGFVDALGADVSDVATYKHLAAPEPVVAAGLRALDRGRPVVVPGWRNWLLANIARVSPGRIATFVSGRMLRPAHPAAR